jgi:hypothetical protein
MTMPKKIVHYKAHPDNHILVGGRACVLPTDHPIQIDEFDEVVATSTVLRYDEKTGEFETENTIYQRIH